MNNKPKKRENIIEITDSGKCKNCNCKNEEWCEIRPLKAKNCKVK